MKGFMNRALKEGN